MPTITYNDFAKLDLRVATVKQAEMVPETDKLIKLTLDVGDEAEGGLGERVIVSSIKPWYKPEELVGRQIIYLANLEPREIRGVVSQGMLLAAEKDDRLSLLALDNDQMKPGDKVG